MSPRRAFRRLLGRHRLPRCTTRERHLIRRKADGRLLKAHHAGLAATMAAMIRPQSSFYFVPVRAWRGRYVAAMDLPAWEPRSGEFTLELDVNAEVLCVGRKVIASINDGGLSRGRSS